MSVWYGAYLNTGMCFYVDFLKKKSFMRQDDTLKHHIELLPLLINILVFNMSIGWLHFSTILGEAGYAIAQVARCWLLTAETQVQSHTT
jgi:hypothetical protein